jgi:single-strand DNA-binding protein
MPYANINRTVLVGRLTKDPELRALPSGLSVCDLRIACNGRQRDPEGGYGERPNYFDVSAFGAHAESVARYLHKGSAVAVDGRLEWREWETADQQRRQAVKIVAESIEFLGGRTSGQEEGESGAEGTGSDGAFLEGAEEREVELVF